MPNPMDPLGLMSGGGGMNPFDGGSSGGASADTTSLTALTALDANRKQREQADAQDELKRRQAAEKMWQLPPITTG